MNRQTDAHTHTLNLAKGKNFRRTGEAGTKEVSWYQHLLPRATITVSRPVLLDGLQELLNTAMKNLHSVARY